MDSGNIGSALPDDPGFKGEKALDTTLWVLEHPPSRAAAAATITASAGALDAPLGAVRNVKEFGCLDALAPWLTVRDINAIPLALLTGLPA